MIEEEMAELDTQRINPNVLLGQGLKLEVLKKAFSARLRSSMEKWLSSNLRFLITCQPSLKKTSSLRASSRNLASSRIRREVHLVL